MNTVLSDTQQQVQPSAPDIRLHLKTDRESIPWLDTDPNIIYVEEQLFALAEILGSAESAIVVWTLCEEMFGETPTNERQLHEGRWWVKGSLSEWTEKHFGRISPKQLSTIMARLEKQNMIIRKQFKLHALDTTYWYTINENAFRGGIQPHKSSHKPTEKSPRSSNRKKTPRPSRTPKRPPETGYVYLLAADNGLHKIGLSKDTEQRLKSFGTLPFNVSFVCVVKTGDMRGLEISLHERFASKRVKGEWFNLETEDVDYILSLSAEGV